MALSEGKEKKRDAFFKEIERIGLAEYVDYMQDTKRRLIGHFMGGLARGLGMAVGFTILGAILVIVLQRLATKNLPLIGDFLAEIVSIVQRKLE